MAIKVTAAYRVRPGGANTNGGGYDTGIATAVSGTNGAFNASTGVFTDATAANFTSGMVGRSILIPGVGQYLITAFTSASSITLGSGQPPVNLSGLAWQIGAGTDYSQQNAAQATGTHGASSNTTTFTDTTAANFTAAMVGNAIMITGVGFFFVAAYVSATQITLDRSPGTISAKTWHLGGAWADPWTNLQTTTTGVTSGSWPVVGGNRVYVLGSGIPNPASYTYDYTLSSSPGNWVVGNRTAGGNIVIENDPATPSYKCWPDRTGGMPCINCNGNGFLQTFGDGFFSLRGLWWKNSSSYTIANISAADARGCVMDTNDNGFGIDGACIGCEVFSSTYSTDTNTGVQAFSQSHVFSCYVHDYKGSVGTCAPAIDCVFRIVNGGITTSGNSGEGPIMNNTIDGIAGTAFTIDSYQRNEVTFFNNLITNCGVGIAGPSDGANTPYANEAIERLCDGNTFYGNTTNYSNISPGARDTILTSDPYVNRAAGNLTLA